MATDGLDGRLRELGRLTREWMDSAAGRADAARRAAAARRDAHVDMSPEALDARLREMSGLAALCADLVRSGPGPHV